MSTSTRIIKNTGYLYVKMGITVLLSLYTTRLILASLGASDFGIFNLVGGVIFMLGFLNVTMANATQRFMSYAEGNGNIENKRRVFNVSLALHIAVAIVTGIILMMAMNPLFNMVFNILPDRVFASKVIYVSLVVSTMFTILNVPYDSVMNAHENMLYYSIIGIIEAFLKLIVAFLCVYSSHDKLIVYGVLMAFIPFITLTIMKVYCHKKYEECVISFHRYWDNGLVKQIASFFSWNFLTAISSLASAYGGGLVLNHFFGTVVNAAQGIANQINGQMSALSANLMKAVNPVIVKMAGSKEIASMNKVTLEGCKFSTLLIALFAVPMVLEMPYVLKLWLKDVPEWTIAFCCLQLVITLICQTASGMSTGVYAEGNIKWYAIYKSIMNLTPVLITYIVLIVGGSPVWFYVVMVLIWAIGGNAVIVYYSHKHCRMEIKTYFTEVVNPVIIVITIMAIGGGLVIFFIPESLLRLVVTIATTSILFASSLFLILNKEEMLAVQNFIKRK